METYSVVIKEIKTGDEQQCLIYADEAETSEEIVLKMQIDGQEIISSNDGYFQAFQGIRDKLLACGYGIKCKGALINAVQSAMMSGCEYVYLVKMKEQASLKNKVSIYAYVDIEEFPDTEIQNRFFREWSCSLSGACRAVL